jgi:HIRAN domain-containing protein
MPTVKGRTWEMELEVIGLKFRWKKDGRAMLARMADKADITGIRIVREPDNKYDPNAVMVLLPERLLEGRQLGYFHRQVAELLAPRLDSGILEVASAKLVSLDPSDAHNTGTLVIVFRDAGQAGKPRAKGKNPATKGKAAKA